jgi:hypothetical protein
MTAPPLGHRQQQIAALQFAAGCGNVGRYRVQWHSTLPNFPLKIRPSIIGKFLNTMLGASAIRMSSLFFVIEIGVSDELPQIASATDDDARPRAIARTEIATPETPETAETDTGDTYRSVHSIGHSEHAA